jgi:hypothetical protein
VQARAYAQVAPKKAAVAKTRSASIIEECLRGASR